MIHPLTHPTRLALHSEAWLRHCLVMAAVSKKQHEEGRVCLGSLFEGTTHYGGETW